jgi:DNA polymerase III epsilon subunit-like protein
MKILVIDIETTGFMNQGGSIVEVGMVELNLTSGAITTVFESLCREAILSARHREEPMGWIFRNSSLTVEMVRQAPPMEELLPRIQEVINRYPLGATAYNRSFDFDFLESRGLHIPVKLPCPMLLATPICKLPPKFPGKGEYKWPSVEEAWNHLFPSISYVEKHRGADDARHEAKIILALYGLGIFTVKQQP